nr:PREDICTED: XK-related protein 4 [Tribolium castaneum]|eukprot:XP_015838073.1 PREDICTED: XK-related protein 4 [Tribolium castaneum]
MWHFSVVGSRIAGVGAVAAFWPTHTKIMTVIHWTLMTTWLLNTTEPTQFSNFNNFWHFMFCSVFGAVYFFNPVNLENQPTRAKYRWFYLIMFVENVVANVGWFVEDNEVTLVWKIAFVTFNKILFAFGIGFMLIYYVKFHPSQIQASFVTRERFKMLYFIKKLQFNVLVLK